MCYQAAADGLGIAIAQQEYVTEDLRSGKLVAPINHVARSEAGYYLVCDPKMAEIYPLKVFRDWIRSVLETKDTAGNISNTVERTPIVNKPELVEIITNEST